MGNYKGEGEKQGVVDVAGGKNSVYKAQSWTPL